MTTVTKAKPAAPASFDDHANAGFTRIDALSAQARENIETLVKPLQEQAEQASAQLRQGYEELQQLQKDNAEALIDSSALAARGAELLVRELNSTAQANLDRTISNGRAVLAARSLREVVDLQASFAAASLEAWVSSTGRLQELSTRITGDVVGPLQARFNATLSQLSATASSNSPIAKTVIAKAVPSNTDSLTG